jgi:HD-like signal output (HDOD) protein
MTMELASKLLPTIELPTLPEIVQRLSRVIDNPEAGAAEVGDLIGEDPALTAKVVLLANSATFGRSEACKSPRQACTLLGLRAVRNLVLHASLLQHFDHLKECGYDISAFWRDAPIVGQGASMLARRIRPAIAPRPDEAYLAGLLRDIGQLILLERVGELYVTIQSAASCKVEPLEAYELRELGLTHADLGAHAVETWGCGESIRDAILQHHMTVSASMQPLSVVVALAERMVSHLNANKFTAAIDAVDPQLSHALGIKREHVSDVAEALHAQLHGSPRDTAGIRAPFPKQISDPAGLGQQAEDLGSSPARQPLGAARFTLVPRRASRLWTRG